jgi:arsenate reductase (thioredoxin)
VTAAATGAIAGAVVVLGRRALVDLGAVAIAVAALALVIGLKRVPEPALIAAAGLAGWLLTAASPQPTAAGSMPKTGPPVPTVVFVCEHGSAKSLVAASFFRRMARERGLDVAAASRGTDPDAAVPPGVVDALRGDGFDVAAFRPQRLTEAEAAAALRVVAIGQDLQAQTGGARLEVWNDIPPVSTDYPGARSALVARIEKLLDELAPGPGRGSEPRP